MMRDSVAADYSMFRGGGKDFICKRTVSKNSLRLYVRHYMRVESENTPSESTTSLNTVED